MQANNKGKAEALGRKAKVYHLISGALPSALVTTTNISHSWPTRTKNSSSKGIRFPIPTTTTCRASSDLVNSEFSNKDLKHVGNYTLGKLIGKGSFGKVYLANHKLTNGSKVRLPGSTTSTSSRY